MIQIHVHLARESDEVRNIGIPCCVRQEKKKRKEVIKREVVRVCAQLKRAAIDERRQNSQMNLVQSPWLIVVPDAG